MAFLRSGLVPDVPAYIAGSRVQLRPPQISDYAQWAELRALSREHLTPWEPAWPRDDLTRAAFKHRVKHYHRESRNDQGYAFLIFTAQDQLAGGIALSNVQRGVSQSASVGYWLGRPFARQGLMTDALITLVSHSREHLRLHRLEAATQPANTVSIRVLERAGFEREGFARDYLKINGAWRDHVLFGRVLDRAAEAAP